MLYQSCDFLLKNKNDATFTQLGQKKSPEKSGQLE